jgi:alcohol dehydrogenase (cytochrome c)
VSFTRRCVELVLGFVQPANEPLLRADERQRSIFTRVDQAWEPGKSFMGGTFGPAPEPAQRVLRALDIQTGKVMWEVPQFGTVQSWGGVLSTAGDIVVFCDDSGALAAADARTGNVLWSFQTSQIWRALPMTDVFDDRQPIAVASGPNIMAFGLP